ncbi:hypothetical protein FRB96_001442 [Tulasnella sp. 330]|nr:hypothetical protein FRB96_001442 [Tulasnella sp. 330]
MQTTAQVGALTLSKRLTDRYMRFANRTYFAPRGLRVRLCKTQAVRRIVGLDPMDKESSFTNDTLQTIGSSLETAGLSLPVVKSVIVRFHPSPALDTRAEPDETKRWIAALEGRALPLEYDVVPPTKPEGLVDEMNALGVKLNTWQNTRSMARSDRTSDMPASRQMGEPTANIEPPQGVVRGALRAASGGILGGSLLPRREAARWGKLGAAVGSTPIGGGGGGGWTRRRLDKKAAVEDRKKASATSSMVWIVVINAEQDKSFKGTALAESKTDIEEIDEHEWEEELDLEDEEDEEALDVIEKSGEK